MSKKHFLKGTLILTCTGLISRMIGFFYRIFLSHSIGAQGLGLYQLIIPVQTLVLAVTTAGIQTVISRLVASHMALGRTKEARDCFILGTASGLFLSFVASWTLYTNADFFAVQILKEPRTYSLIRLLCFSLPLNTLHTCINSFYFAQKKTEIPSGIQLFEQLVRVGTSYLLYVIFLSEGREITPVIAIGGTLVSEAAVALVSLLLIGTDFHHSHYIFRKISQPFQKLRNIFQLALPLTLNRLLLTLLNSIEVVLIPQQLRLYGLSAEEALSIYGVFTGMALPMILFPSTVTNSVSVMLMPSIAELQALGYKKRIRYVTFRTCLYCLLLGGGCSLVFLFFGKTMGILLFKSLTAGIYIRTMAFICPFLYMNTTLTSILHGLGKSGICLINNAIGISIRIAFVLNAIPLLGIRGYLYGILLSESVLSILHVTALLRLEQIPKQNLPIDN